MKPKVIFALASACAFVGAFAWMQRPVVVSTLPQPPASLASPVTGGAEPTEMEADPVRAQPAHESATAAPAPAGRAGAVFAPSATLAQQRAAVKALLANGTRAEVLALLTKLEGAGAGNEALLPALVTPMSEDALRAMASVIADEPGTGLPPHLELSDGLADAMRKALQSQPEQSAVAAALLDAWRSAGAAERQQIEAQEVPALYAALIAELAGQDMNEALLYAARLETCENPRTGEAILELAQSPALPLNELCDLMANWSRDHLQPAQASQMEAVISAAGSTLIQRGLAGLALGGAPDAASHVRALQKAAASATDPWLRDCLRTAIELAGNRSNSTSTTPR